MDGIGAGGLYKTRAALLCALLLAAGFGAFWWVSSRGGDPEPGAPAGGASSPAAQTRAIQKNFSSNASNASAGSAARASAGESKDLKDIESNSKKMESGLEGADGALLSGLDGRLLLSPELIAFFEQELEGADDPESLREARARLLQSIYAHLDGQAAIQAIEILDQYLDYKKAKGRGDAPAEPSDKLPLERAYFGDSAANQLFGTGEDGAVSGEAERLLSLSAEEKKMRAAGAGDEEIQRLRVERVGAEAAQWLLERDRRRTDWERRLNTFELEIKRRSAGLSGEQEKRAAREKLLEMLFTPEERPRARVLLSISSN